jgi:hypothetical protein
MPDSPSEPEQPKPDGEPKMTSTDRADLIAVGIGCAVFIIMFIAIVLVGISRGEG